MFSMFIFIWVKIRLNQVHGFYGEFNSLKSISDHQEILERERLTAKSFMLADANPVCIACMFVV